MKNISFSSRIKPVTLMDYATITMRIPHEQGVHYPWTIRQSVKAADVYTKGVIDCSACLITDGSDAVLMHLTPDNGINHAFSLVTDFLRGKIDLKNPNLQAVLLGSKNTEKSQDIYNKFKTFLERFKIPYTELKNGKTPTSVTYKTSEHTVFVTSAAIDKMLKKGFNAKEALNSGFEKISLANCDEIAV